MAPPRSASIGKGGAAREGPSAASGGRRDFLLAAAVFAGGALVPAMRRSASGAPAPDVQGGPPLKAQKLAWAGVRLQLGKDTLLLDPLISPGVWGPALRDPLVPIDVGTDGAHFVLITHRHPDHFDRAAVRKGIGETGTLVCSPDTAAIVASAGISVRPISLYEPALLSDFTVTAVPAVDGYGDPQVSWIVSAGGRRIIHCGDTLWHGWWWQIGRQFGPFDAAFLPINGARFLWRKPVSDVPAVMTPEQAVAAAIVLGARLVVPIHYGVIGAEGYREVPDPESALLSAAKKRAVGVEIVRPGDWLTWRPRN